MKKLFLIPLMACFTCVMAWGTDVANLTALRNAIQNASSGSTVNVRLTPSTTSISGAAVYDDDVQEYGLFCVPAGVTVNLDLNGKTLKVNTAEYGNYTVLVADGAVLNLVNTNNTAATFGHEGGEAYTIYAYGSVSFDNNINVKGGFTGDTWWGSPSFSFKSTYSGIVTGDGYINEGVSWTLEDGCQGKFCDAFKTAVEPTLTDQSFEKVGNYWQLVAAAAQVAQIGSTTYPSLAAAVDAATSGQTITLLEDVAEEVTITKSVTLAGNKTISRPLHLNGNITFTMAGVTIDAAGYSYGIRLDGNNNTYVINLANGSTNTVAGVDGIGGFNSNPTLTISGNGTLNINAQTTFANMVSATVTAANLKANISGGSYGKIAEAVTTLSLQAGQYSKQPTADQIAEGYSAIKVVSTGYYSVVNNSTVVAIYKDDLFSSLADALNAASADAMANVTLVKNVNESITINKNTVIYTSGYSVANTVVAGSGYTRVQHAMFGDVVLFLQNDLASFIGLENYTFTPAADLDLSDLGGYIPVWGNKTLILNEGITLTLKYAGNYPTLAVQNGATFTIKGKGTITTDKDAIKVENGGTLIVGVDGSADRVNITTSVKRQCNFAIRNAGQTTIYNVNIDGMSGAILNSTNGKVDIKGGRFVGHSTSNDVEGYGWTYAINNCGNMTIKNAYVQGVHGAVACRESKGTLELQNCDIRALNENDGVVHYALYVSTNAIVSAYNTKFYSEHASNTILIGDDDVHNTFGLIYLYGGCKTNRKMYVQQRKEQDQDILFPVSISEGSAWYTAAQNGGFGPLPAGFSYQAINESADGCTYNFAVVGSATSSEDASGSTTTWQQTSTWNDSTVPTDETAVVIPEGKGVVVSNSESDKTAEANQVNIASNGSLTVQENTSLTITNGINIAEGGALVVNEGGAVIVGEGGLISADESNIVLTSSEENASTLLLNPAVKENTQPKATYKFKSQARRLGSNNYIWQRFGAPTFNGAVTMSWTADVRTAVYEYDYVEDGWKMLPDQSASKQYVLDGHPFQCYLMTIGENPDEDVEYTFTGSLMGNANAPLHFELGWNSYANSYTAPIDVKSFFAEIGKSFPGVSASVYVYKRNDNGTTRWIEINNQNIVFNTPVTKINPMQAFILQLREGEAGEKGAIKYVENVYNPFMGIEPNQAPARVREESNLNGAYITVTDGVETEELKVLEGADFSDEFDNGWDAEKLENENNFSLYCQVGDLKLSSLATNDLTDKTIAFNTKNAGEFTLNVVSAVGTPIKVYDKVAKRLIELTEGEEYVFTAEAIDEAARFIINPSDAPSAIDNTEIVVKASKFMKDGQLYIRRGDNVYTVQGQNVK